MSETLAACEGAILDTRNFFLQIIKFYFILKILFSLLLFYKLLYKFDKLIL